MEESNIEMTWRTFSGPQADHFAALVKARADQHGVNLQQADEVADYFRAHLERGISNIQNVRNIASLLTERSY